MKKLMSLLMVLCLMLALVACGQAKPAEESKAEETTAEAAAEMTVEESKAEETKAEESLPADAITADIKGNVAMITDVGGINDESFNQSAWMGMEELQKKGVVVSFIESHKDADYAPNLEMKVEEGNDLIWGIGFLMKGAMGEIAQDNPDQLFALIDDAWADGEMPNAIGVNFHAEESSFLVGYIASYMTKTNHVGFVLGMEGPTMFRFKYGYMAGVAYGAKEQGKEIKVDSVTIETFSDTAKGKATATKMFTDGADIVFHAAGQAGSGAIEAAKDMNKMAIGVDLDQNKLAPDHVITSALKNVHAAVEDVSMRVLKGEKLGGQTLYYGLKEGGVGIAPSSDKHVPAEILEKEKALEAKIIAGEIKVPITEEEYNAFIK